MTGAANKEPGGFARESSRIALNLVSMVSSRFLCLALSLVQMGIIFRALGVDGSGQFGFALNYPALFTVFATLGIHRLLIRDIARQPAIAWVQVWTATAVLAVLSLLVTCVIMATMWTADPMTRRAVFVSTLSVIGLYALQRPFESLLMARERMVWLSAVQVAGGVARLAFTAWALRFESTSVAAHGGIAAGNVLAFAFCVGACIKVAGWERPHLRLKLAFEQIRESNAFTVAVLFSLLYFKSDMSLLKWLRGDSAAGIYTAAQRVVEPLFMVASIWGTTVFPALCRFSVDAPGNYEKLVRMSARFALLAALPMGFGLAVLAQPVIALLTGNEGGQFDEAVTVLQILSIVTPFFYFNSVGQEFLYARHRNWFVVFAYGLGSVVNIGANLILIPRYGALGAGWAAVAASGIISVVFLQGMRHEYGAMRLVSLGIKTLIACGIMSAAVHYIAPWSLVAGIVFGVVVYFAAQLVLKTPDADERRMLAAALAGVFKKA